MAERTYDLENTTQQWLDARPEELTDVALEPELLHLWCPSVFMYGEVLDRGQPDGLGMKLRVHTKGFLPHSFFFVAEIVDLIPHRYMRVAVTGDFEGFGDVSLQPDGDGCQFHLHWRISLMHPWLRPLSRPLGWVFMRNHKWAMRHMCRLLETEVRRRRDPEAAVREERATFPHNLVVFRNWQRRRAASARWRGEGLGPVSRIRHGLKLRGRPRAS